jgi:small-conductance mechanosensitive channel
MRWLVPILVGILLALGGGYTSLHFMARATAQETEHLRESRSEDRAEVQRMAARQHEADAATARYASEQADRWSKVDSALARIEARLDAMERRRER